MTENPRDRIPDPVIPRDKDSISIGTLVCYLFGSQAAINKLAENKQTPWLGLLFVISAGFAREYDGEDLLREPWHLLLPLVASLTTSFLLFVLVFLLALRGAEKVDSFWKLYWKFLGAYWMTAPLAWLYAIPVERFLPAPEAVSMNLQILGLVAFWRVALITRVIAVVFQLKVLTVLPLVMLFADTVLLVLLFQLPSSFALMALMSGVRLSQSEMAFTNATFRVTAVAILTFPFCLIGALVVIFSERNPPINEIHQTTEMPKIDESHRHCPNSKIQRKVWAVAVFSILGWSVVLPYTQREQQLRFEVEHFLKAGQLKAAVHLMVTHEIGEFPPGWDPPPHALDAFRGRQSQTMVDMVELLVENPQSWAYHVYLEKFRRHFCLYRHWRNTVLDLSNADRLRFLDLLDKLPERNQILVGDDDFNGLIHALNDLVGFESKDAGERGIDPVSDEVSEGAKRLLKKGRDFEASLKDQ